VADTLIATPGAQNADSYNTLAELEAHFAKYGAPDSGWTGESDDAKCIAARNGVLWMDPEWEWTGSITDRTLPQALAFPRVGLRDREGRIVADSVIPDGIKRLHAEVTKLVAEGKILLGELERGGQLTGETIGPLSFTYSEGAPGESIYPLLDKMAEPYTSGGCLRMWSNGG
jgi:hypothetical protein